MMWVVRNDAREMMTLMKYDVFYACRIVDTAVKMCSADLIFDRY